MPRVTTLRPSRGGRFVVHVDGVYVGTVSEAAVARNRLHLDRELSNDEAVALRGTIVLDSAFADAYRLLAQRSRGRHEMERRLAAKGHHEEIVAAVLMRLQAEGLLNDAAFAAAYVADKRRLAGWGRERIAVELRRLGVDASVTEEALGPPESSVADEALQAASLLARMGTPGAPLEAARKRAFDRLRRRGFSTAIAYAAVQAWIAGSEEATGQASQGRHGPRDPQSALDNGDQ
jgi:regulatory protein